MDKIINPLDGEMDLLGDTKSDIVRKLNPLNGRLEVVYKADSYIQKINPFIGDFDMVGGTGASYIIKEVTGNGYINLTNAVANHLMELKAYGGTEQLSKTYIDSVTAEGKCVQASTPTPTTPVDIACNNGTIKFSKNMANVNSQTALVGYYVSTSGVVTADIYNRIYQDFIPCKPSTTYTLSCSSSVYYVTISEYSTAEDSGFVIRKAGSTGSNTQLTITTGATTNYLRFGANLDRTTVTMAKVLAINWQLEIGDTPTTYHEYVEGGIYIDGTTETITDSSGLTATCQNLLGVGNYKDTQEILTGLVTRNIGILVLDGTENWTASVTYIGSCFLQLSPITAGPYYPIFVTHFVGETAENKYGVGDALYNGRNLSLWLSSETTAATLKQWLAEQYVAGTPVILVYPLTTATTNTVTGQQLNIAPVTATGSVSDLVATAVTSVHTTPTPTQPLDINCNNGVVKVSPNLFNKNSYTEINAYVNSNTGKLTVGSPGESTQYCAVIPCLPNTTYTISGRASSAWGAFTSSNIGTTATSFDKTENGSITTGANDKYLIGLVRANQDVIDYRNTLQVEIGSTATSYRPYGQIYVDGTTETIGVNLLDLSDVDNGHYYSGTGVYTSLNVARLSNFIPVKAGDTLSVTTEIGGGSTSLNVRYNFFDTSKQWLSQSTYTLSVAEGKHTEQVTAQQDGYFAFSGNYTGSGTILNWNTVVIMNNRNNATAEMLLKVGDYVDEQEILSGSVTRNIGIKVLDGTESWTMTTSSDRYMFYLSDNGDAALNTTALCNIATWRTNSWAATNDMFVTRSNRNFGFMNPTGFSTSSTVQDWTTYVSNLYNAGTPVIVIYPLNTPTTESVAGQTMHIPAGNSTIEITQASINNLGLYAKYKATE